MNHVSDDLAPASGPDSSPASFQVELLTTDGGPDGTCSDGKTCLSTFLDAPRAVVLVKGRVITDPERLGQLGVADGEALVEIPADLVPDPAEVATRLAARAV